MRKLNLQLLFPDPRACAITAAAVCLNQELGCVRIPLVQFCLAPMCQIVHRERWRISRLSNGDCATIGAHIIDPIGDGLPQRVVWKIVGINFFCRLAPDLARVFEVADQFLLLGIHTDDGLVRRAVLRTLHSDVTKLLIALRMLRPCGLFEIGTQTVAVGTQDATDHRLTDPMPVSIQPLAQITQAPVEPFLIAHWIAGRMRCHKRENQCFEQRIFFQRLGVRHLAAAGGSVGHPLSQLLAPAVHAE